MEIKSVKTESFNMDYFCFGNGPRPLVIIPGLSVQSVMLSADMVAEAYSEMAEDFTVYVFDRRKDPPGSYSIREMAEDMVSAMKEAGLGRACIFGASQGGMITLSVAASHPEIVERVALSSTTACVTEEDFRTFRRWEGMAEDRNAEKLYMDFGETVYPQEVFDSSRELLASAAKTVKPEELKEFIIFAESMRGFDIRDELIKVTCPVLSIGDTSDLVFGGEAPRRIGDYLGDGASFEAYTYEGYGHAVYDTAPDFKKRLIDFFME